MAGLFPTDCIHIDSATFRQHSYDEVVLLINSLPLNNVHTTLEQAHL